MKSRYIALLAGICALTAAGPSGAAISSVTPNMTLIAPPADVLLNNPVLENNQNLWLFEEKKGVTLGVALFADVTVDGDYNQAADLVGVSGNIAAGTVVDSYFIHVDPIDDGPASYVGTVTFDRPILGVLISDATLNASDAIFGAPATTYSTGQLNRGLEMNGQDWFTVSGNTLTVNLFQAYEVMDQVRVVTATSIPEPIFFQLGSLLGMGGLGMLKLRKR